MRKASFFHQEMSTRDHFHEFQFSEKRKKVDTQLMDSAVTSSHGEKNSLKSESVCDLRKSLAWDSAFFTSPGVLDPDELFGTLNVQFVGGDVVMAQGRGRKSLKLEFAEPETTNATRPSSVRKSLAWDNAFLTSEGVLNTEELSIVNRGFRKSEIHEVPEANEELWRSAESNASTLHDDYSLASLEVDLFDDMRSSLPNSVAASQRQTGASPKLAGEKRLHNGHTARKPPASRLVRDSNGVSPLSSLKPPKVSGPVNPPPRAPKKRVSLGANKDGTENKTTRRASYQKSMTLPKKTCLRDSFFTVSCSRPSSKSSSTVLHSTKRELAGISGGKSANPLRRTDSELVSSLLSSRTPPNFSSRKRSDSASLLSTPKSSSCASSLSSADGLPSDFPASSVEWRLNHSSATKSTPCRVVSCDFDGPQGLDSQGQHNNVASFRSPPINRNAAGSITSPVSPLTELKNSGLRLPSPKIGFFDTESPTSLPLNDHSKLQSGLQHPSKAGTGSECINASANRKRIRNPAFLEKVTGSVSDTSTKDKLRISSREKNQQNATRRISDRNFHRPEEDNKENAGNLENQVDVLIKRMDAISFTKSKGSRSLSSVFLQNTRKL